MGKEAKILTIPLVAANADGSGLYQCPYCQEWTEAEENQTIECDYCSEEYRTITSKKRKRAAKVITMKFPDSKPC